MDKGCLKVHFCEDHIQQVSHMVSYKSIWQNKHNIEMLEILLLQMHEFFDSSCQYVLEVFTALMCCIGTRHIKIGILDWVPCDESRRSLQSRYLASIQEISSLVSQILLSIDNVLKLLRDQSKV